MTRKFIRAEVTFDEGVAAYRRSDYETALRKFRPLAEEGIAEAQFNLGLMYANGMGVLQDFVHAHMWFELVAARFSPGQLRGSALEDLNIVASKMSPEQITQAQRQARNWTPKV